MTSFPDPRRERDDQSAIGEVCLKTNRGENGFVLRYGDDAQPMPEILQQRSIGNIVHLFITDEKNLFNSPREMKDY